MKKVLVVLALLLVPGIALALPTITFDTTPGGAGGSLTYDGLDGPLVGTGIVFVEIVGRRLLRTIIRDGLRRLHPGLHHGTTSYRDQLSGSGGGRQLHLDGFRPGSRSGQVGASSRVVSPVRRILPVSPVPTQCPVHLTRDGLKNEVLAGHYGLPKHPSSSPIRRLPWVPSFSAPTVPSRPLRTKPISSTRRSSPSRRLCSCLAPGSSGPGRSSGGA